MPWSRTTKLIWICLIGLRPLAGSAAADEFRSVGRVIGGDSLPVADSCPGPTEPMSVSPTSMQARGPTHLALASTAGALCGDGVRQGSETCDDGNLWGGDGCAANCTIESDAILDFGNAAETQSSMVIQTLTFPIHLPITGSQILTYGSAREDPSAGADGFTNFAHSEVPTVLRISKNLKKIDPIKVPGLACICVRGVEMQTCGGEPTLPGDANVCTATVNPCPVNLPCAPTFGPGNSGGGRFADGGLEVLDYNYVCE